MGQRGEGGRVGKRQREGVDKGERKGRTGWGKWKGRGERAALVRVRRGGESEGRREENVEREWGKERGRGGWVVLKEGRKRGRRRGDKRGNEIKGKH